MNFNDLWPYKLRRGNSDDPRDGACTMDAVSWFTYGRLGDHPQCACPILTAFVVVGNDAMRDGIRQRLKPFIFRLAGSRDPAAEEARTRHVVLETARRIVPLALEEEGLADHARCLRELPDDASYQDIEAAAWAAERAATTRATWTAREAAAARELAWAATAAAEAAAKEAAKEAARAAKEAAKEAGGRRHGRRRRRSASEEAVWDTYIKILDEALNLGKQGSLDLERAHQRVREFEEARA